MLVLAGVAFIDAVDRQTLAGVIPLVQDDLGFSDFQIGTLGSIFVLTSFLATIPAGYLADRLRRTRLIAIVLAIWSCISATNAAVMNYWQFLAIRATLGVGEVLGNPASASLIADYYPATLRGRAYSYQRVAPIFGLAVGLSLSGLVGSLLGWRVAFLLVGPPGALFAFWVWRMREPARGESDGTTKASDEDDGRRTRASASEGAAPSEIGEDDGRRTRASASEGAAPSEIGEAGILHEATRRGLASLLPEIKVAVGVRSLRALMVGSAISTGATAGFGFWAAAFYERHTVLGVGGAASVVGGVVLVGAVVGILAGGRAADRARQTNVAAPMLMAGTCQSIAAAVFFVTFFPVPLWVRLPGHIVAVAFLLAAIPALAAMISQVIPAAIRGISFSLTGFLTALVAAVSPLLIGWLADRFPVAIDGVMRGNLAVAFGIVTPLIFLGALVVLNGRRHVAADIEGVDELAEKLTEGSTRGGSS